MKLKGTCVTIQCTSIARMYYDTIGKYWYMVDYNHHFCISSIFGRESSLYTSALFRLCNFFFGKLLTSYSTLIEPRSASFSPVCSGQVVGRFLSPYGAGLASPQCFHVVCYVWINSSKPMAWGSCVFMRAMICVPSALFKIFKISSWTQQLVDWQRVGSTVAINELPWCNLSVKKQIYSLFDALKGN